MSKCQLNKDVIENYRYINVEDVEWWEHIFSDFEEDMSKLGVSVKNIYFSGFWSQGDGACFEGHIEDWGLYLLHLGYDSDILANLAKNWWSCKWEKRGHYCHEHTVLFDPDIYMGDNPYIERDDPLRHDAWQFVANSYDFLAIDNEIEQNLRQHMRDLYSKLREEYEHLITDEAVIEWLEFNDKLTELEI
jgi:hypothetical protein